MAKDKKNKTQKKEEKIKRSKEEKRQIAGVVLLGIIALVMLVVTTRIFFSDESTGASLHTTQNNSIVCELPTASPESENTTAAPIQQQTTTEPDASNQNQQGEKEPISNINKEPNPADEKQEILKKVSDGVNKIKASDASFIGKKTQIIDIALTDCSVPRLTSTINGVLEFFMGEEVLEYDFTNGVATDPEEGGEITSNELIPPTLLPFSLSSEGVAKAYAEKKGENTVYTIVVVPETSTIDSKPPHHNAACDTLDLSAFEIPMGEITKADYEYPGATVSVTYDAAGNVVEYHERLDLKGTGEGNILGISASGTMEGYIDETWEINWK